MAVKLYRVTCRSTQSLQPRGGDTYWQAELVYCGDDATAARIAYHSSRVADRCGSYGNPCRETTWEVLDEPGDDEPGEFASE
jgi:hypothetical protein